MTVDERWSGPRHRVVRRVLLAVAMIVVAVAWARPAAAVQQAVAQAVPARDVPPQVVLLFDLSGSMNDDGGGGRSKLDAAKAGMLGFVEDLPDETRVGIWTYPGGAKDPAGCSVGSAVGGAGLRGKATSTLQASIRSLGADGDTPTGPALRAAAQQFNGNGPRTVILVSDGEENCGEPACDVARSLAGSGVDTTIYTVGFQISPKGEEALRCVADATGGTYAKADTATSIIDQLDDFARAKLSVEVLTPEIELTPAYSSGTNDVITVEMEVANTGATDASDVQAILTFTGTGAPGIAQPRRYLGNLRPGERSTRSWELRAPTDFRNQRFEFEVSVVARNGDLVTLRPAGTVHVRGEVSLASAGALLRDRQRVAILGDSYSAGEGAPGFLPGTDEGYNACHRSDKTYAKPLYGDRAKVIACSGAEIKDILLPSSSNWTNTARLERVPSQLDELASVYGQAGPDLVLLTIGGNDLGFRNVISACVQQLTDCDQAEERHVTDRLPGVGAAARDVYRAIDRQVNSDAARAARGGATTPIVVLAYPRPFPQRTKGRDTCPGTFASNEMSWGNDLVGRLNAVLGASVKALADQGRPVHFVPNTEFSLQPAHTLCDGRESWMNPIHLEEQVGAKLLELHRAAIEVRGTLTEPLRRALLRRVDHSLTDLATTAPVFRHAQYAMHPNERGYQAETAALVAWSRGVRPPDPGFRNAEGCDCVGFPSGRPGVLVIGAGAGGGVELEPGATHRLQGAGAIPHSIVDVELHSQIVPLGQALVSDDGTYTLDVAIPSETPIGDHELVVASRRPDGSRDEQRLRAAVVPPPLPWWANAMGAASAAASVVAGTGLWRRRGAGGAPGGGRRRSAPR